MTIRPNATPASAPAPTTPDAMQSAFEPTISGGQA